MNKLTRSPGHIWICMQTDIELFPAAFTANGYDTKETAFFGVISCDARATNDEATSTKGVLVRVALLQPINHAARRLLRRVGAVLLGDWRGIYSIARTLVHRVWATQANV